MEMNLMYRGMASPVSGCRTCQSGGMHAGMNSAGDVVKTVVTDVLLPGWGMYNQTKSIDAQQAQYNAQREAEAEARADRRERERIEREREKEKREEREKEREHALKMAKLQKGATPPSTPTPDNGNKKLLIYGGIGAVVLTGIVVAVALISKKKK